MNTVIQPRHIKLWLAGNARNWPYAEYERHNIGQMATDHAVVVMQTAGSNPFPDQVFAPQAR